MTRTEDRYRMKILHTDLDGTLLNKASLVSERTKEELKRFTDAGNLLVPNSGRPLLSIQKLLDSAGIADMVRFIVAYNGALIWDRDKDAPAWTATVPFDCARLIQDRCIASMIHIQTYNHETLYTVTEDMAINYYRKRIFLPVVYSEDPIGMCDEEPYKMLAIDLEDHSRLCKLTEELTPVIGDRINMVFSNPYYLEFFNRAAGKGNAVFELCKLLDVPIEDTYAAGDEENDISMIEAAGCGIAMANATEAVKKISDVVTTSDNDNDGLAEYLAELI